MSAVTVSFDLKSNLIVLAARINGSPRRLVLDTGASQTMLDSNAARDLQIDAVERRTARGAGGDIDVSLAPLNSVAIDDARVENLTCIVSDVSGISEKLGGNIDGVLGYDFLSKFTVTIDYAARRLTLLPYDRFTAAPRIEGDTFIHPASGLTVTSPGAAWNFVTKTRLPQIVLIFQHRDDAAASIEFQVQEIHGLTLEQIWPAVREALRLEFSNYRELASTARKLDSHNARQLDFTGEQKGQAARIRLIALMQDGCLWTITCTAAPTAFAALAKDFDQTLDKCRLAAPSIQPE